MGYSRLIVPVHRKGRCDIPPIPQYPNTAPGQPTINWGAMAGAPTWSAHGAQAGAMPSSSGGDPQADARRWDAYVQQIQQALQASAGFERVKLQKQYEDAEKGRENAYKIAQLSAETSR